MTRGSAPALKEAPCRDISTVALNLRIVLSTVEILDSRAIGIITYHCHIGLENTGFGRKHGVGAICGIFSRQVSSAYIYMSRRLHARFERSLPISKRRNGGIKERYGPGCLDCLGGDFVRRGCVTLRLETLHPEEDHGRRLDYLCRMGMRESNLMKKKG